MARPLRRTGIEGSVLRKLRRRERWSQADLAKKLAVAVPSAGLSRPARN